MLKKASRRITAVAAAAMMFVSIGCSDATGPVAPAVAPVTADASLLGLVGGLVGGLVKILNALVGGLLRPTPVPQDYVVSKVIGSSGGTITVPQTGFTLVVPMGAVSKNTTFKVTALAGKLIAYDFEPHGTTFTKPLTATQDLTGTNWKAAPDLTAAYYADKSQLDPKNGTAIVNEFLPLVINAATNKASWNINHFSGYMVATGKSR